MRVFPIILINCLFCIVFGNNSMGESNEPSYTLYTEILDFHPESWHPRFAVDWQGELWISSGGRTFHFDGTVWIDHSEFTNDANYLCCSPDSLLWYASDSQLIRYDGSGWSYSDIEKDNASDILCAMSASSNSVVWLAFNNSETGNCYLVRYDGSQYASFHDGLLQNHVSRLTATRTGGVWILYHNLFDSTDCNENSCPKGITYMEGQEYHHYSTHDGLPESSSGPVIDNLTDVTWIIQENETSDIYLICNDNLVRKTDDGWKVIRDDIPHSIVCDGIDGSVWLGHIGNMNGSNLLWYNDNKLIDYDTSEFLSIVEGASDYLGSFSMANTSDGYIWIGTNIGVVRINSDTLVANSVTGVTRVEIIPQNINLSCYPNPFNSTIAISYAVTIPGHVAIDVYSLNGQKIKSILSSYDSKGTHTVQWDGKDGDGVNVSSGLYIVSLHSTNNGRAANTVTFLK